MRGCDDKPLARTFDDKAAPGPTVMTPDFSLSMIMVSAPSREARIPSRSASPPTLPCFAGEGRMGVYRANFAFTDTSRQRISRRKVRVCHSGATRPKSTESGVAGGAVIAG